MMEIRPTMMDRMVAAFSPRAGVERLAARATFMAATALSSGPAASSSPTQPGGRFFGRNGGFNAGNSDRRQTRSWFARNRSANADYIGSQRTLISRSRYAAMNMPLGTAGIERQVAFTVGTGLMAIPEIDPAVVGVDPEEVQAISARIAADYDEYMASTDPDAERTSTGYGLQDITLRGVLESGDMLQLRVMPEDQPGRVSSTAWKLYEADWIVSPLGHVEGEPLASGDGAGNVCVAGIEMDGYSAPIAFHILKKDPGTVYQRTANDTVRIPAWGAQSNLPSAVHVMAKKRAAQARGVPVLAPVLEVLKQVSDLTDAELFAAVLTGMLAVIYKSPGAGAMPEPDYTPDEKAIVSGGLQADSVRRADYGFEPGSVMEIDSDSDVKMEKPGRPNPAFDPFFMALARQISAAIEVPVEVLLLHFLSSYTASRAAFETFYQMIFRKRDWLASHAEVPRYCAWLFEQVARGRYKLKGFLTDPVMRAAWSRVRYRGDGKISMDPAREAKALEVHEAHAWSTGAQITAALNGGDYDTNLRVRAAEHARFVASKLPIPNVVGGGNGPADATVSDNEATGDGQNGA